MTINGLWSPSLRGRGLKYHIDKLRFDLDAVALFARAWIEITPFDYVYTTVYVALFARAWIEIFSSIAEYNAAVSPSLRGRGLNYHILGSRLHHGVALFTRAWIEIFCHVRCDCHRNFIQKQGLKLMIFCFTIRNSYY